jgi:hypothetical protein
MALVLKDRVRETSITAGTGTITLIGAVAGFQSFSVIGNGNNTYYVIADSLTGEWEVGIGTYTSSGATLSRDTILESSNGGTAVNFSGNIKDVFCTYPAERSVYVDGSNIVPGATATLPLSSLGGLGSGVATFLATPSSANLATAVTDETGSGSLVFANSPTLTTPNLGTPSAATLTNATGLPTAGLVDNAVTDVKLRDSAALSVIGRSANSTGDPADIAAGTDHQVLRRSGTALGFGAVALNQSNAVTGTLPIANGGTGATTNTAAITNLGATTVGSNFFTLTNPSAIRFPRINANNTVSSLTDSDFRTAIGAGVGNGTVTSVGGTGTVQGLTLSGTVTSSGNLTLGGSLSAVSLTTQVSGTLPLGNGGTGQTTAQAAINALAGATTSGQYLRGNGSNVLMSAIQAGDVPTLNQNTTGSAATLTTGRTIQTNLASTSAATFNGSANITPGVTGTLPVANGGTGITSFGTGVAAALGANVSGSGGIALTTSPTFTTPVLGTPTSGTLSNCTVDGTNSVGFRNIPQQAQNATYTLVLADSGKHIYKNNTTAYTWTIPANGSVAFPVGTAITFVNGGASGNITIAITTDTMRLAGPGTTGSRTLAGYGIATAVKVASTTWIISGTGLT